MGGYYLPTELAIINLRILSRCSNFTGLLPLWKPRSPA